RRRGFRRPDANRLSRHVAFPVIASATGLKLARLAGRGLEPRTLAPFGLGALASFASTLASTSLIPVVESEHSLAPFAVYRVALGAAVLRRLRSGRMPS
ncbi:MAG: hypothetical protein J2O48_12355, partial [Solirubrobacterales bacterium]|nr:hypothetical protein [Solirubrobacterales bacterium]